MTDPGLVTSYDIRSGNGAGPFLQPQSPHGAQAEGKNEIWPEWTSGIEVTKNRYGMRIRTEFRLTGRYKLQEKAIYFYMKHCKLWDFQLLVYLFIYLPSFLSYVSTFDAQPDTPVYKKRQRHGTWYSAT